MGQPNNRICSKGTQGTETSKYLKEKKSIETPLVAASERGLAQTTSVMVWGVDTWCVMWIVEIGGIQHHRG